MRRIPLLTLMAFTLLLAACSFGNNFDVVNASDGVVEVRYKVKQPTDPRMTTNLPNIAPFVKPSSEIHKQVAWQQLPASRYHIDSNSRTVTLALNPGEALLLVQCRPANEGSTGDCESDAFYVEEISITGRNGEISLKGEQTHKMFVAERDNEYTLTYR